MALLVAVRLPERLVQILVLGEALARRPILVVEGQCCRMHATVGRHICARVERKHLAHGTLMRPIFRTHSVVLSIQFDFLENHFVVRVIVARRTMHGPVIGRRQGGLLRPGASVGQAHIDAIFGEYNFLVAEGGR